MNITYKQIKQLKPYKNNAKKHPREQVERIAESIKQFGFTQPVLIDKHNNVVAGHGRILGAKQAGLTKVPTVCLDDLTEEQINAYRLVDNKLNESAWDDGLLNMELEVLFDTDIDMCLFGFGDETTQENQENETYVHFKVKNKNKVIVECASVDEVESLYDELMERGFVCIKKIVK